VRVTAMMSIGPGRGLAELLQRSCDAIALSATLLLVLALSASAARAAVTQDYLCQAKPPQPTTDGVAVAGPW